MKVVALNLASGRGADGRALDAGALSRALGALADGGEPDVVALSEVDDAQPRSSGLDQAATAAAALGTAHWRAAPTLAGTPGRERDWTPLAGTLRGPDGASSQVPSQVPSQVLRGPTYGIALLVRRPVASWHALDLGTGHGRLPLPVTDPVSGRPGLLLFPDEPRVVVAAVLDDGTVVAGAHLSFSPPTALRQLRRATGWLRGLARTHGSERRVLLAGDLNLPAPLVRLAAGVPTLVRAPTFPAAAPRLQLDHVVSLGPGAPVTARGRAVALDVGDHRALVVETTAG